jgi:hypothetical protein
MRIGLRKTSAAVGVAAGLLTTAAIVTPAHASSAGASSAAGKSSTAHTSSAAGSSAAGKSSTVSTDGGKVSVRRGANGALTVTVSGQAAPAAAAASPPSTSPAVEHPFVPPGGSFTCLSGFACAGVPYSNGTYVFKFIHYDGYSVSFWHGSGFVINNQTGGAAIRIDDVNGHQVRCFSPNPNPVNGVNWEPIWRVRLTAGGC